MYLAIEWITVEGNHLADQALSCCVDVPAFWEQLCFNFFFYTRLRKRIDQNNVYLFILFMIILIDTCPLGAMHVLKARVQKRKHR